VAVDDAAVEADVERHHIQERHRWVRGRVNSPFPDIPELPTEPEILWKNAPPPPKPLKELRYPVLILFSIYSFTLLSCTYSILYLFIHSAILYLSYSLSIHSFSIHPFILYSFTRYPVLILLSICSFILYLFIHSAMYSLSFYSFTVSINLTLLYYS
jgi:hypothetical protein